jgi:hypothetical protein
MVADRLYKCGFCRVKSGRDFCLDTNILNRFMPSKRFTARPRNYNSSSWANTTRFGQADVIALQWNMPATLRFELLHEGAELLFSGARILIVEETLFYS